MKKNILLLLAIFGLSLGTLHAQVPEAVNYQGVARDASGSPLTNQAIGLQISIRSGGAAGPVEYQETHSVTTNNLGLFTLMIGQGTTVSGTFSAINWGGNSHFVEVEMDPTGGTSYTSIGTSQLVTVPYAFHANTVENDAVDDADADPTNEHNTGLNLNGTTLEVTDGGGTLTQDLSSLQDGVNDADADPNNELNTGMGLSGTTLSITDAGGTLSQDLSSLQDGVIDADADSTNELNTSATLNGSNLELTDAGGTLTVDLSSLGGSDNDWTITGNDINHAVGNVGINSTTFTNKLQVVETSSATTAAVWATGVFGPTYGQLGVQGDTDHEGILNLDISGNEIGVLGISTGGSSTDNYGIFGHSNGWGGRFQHDVSTNQVYLAGSASAIQIIDGNQAAGLVLTSDANGNGTWQAASGGDADWTISGADMATGAGHTGNLGIKTPAPLAEVHLTQNDATIAGAGGMRFQWTTSYWKIFHSGIHFSFVDDGTRVAYVEGNTGNYVQPSDGHLKKNVTPITNVKDRMLQLRPVAYHYKQMKDTDKKTIGFIAQEVDQIFPEVVRTSEDGYKALSYSDFAVLSVRAIQEQQEEIDAANARIEKLEQELETIKQMIRDNR